MSQASSKLRRAQGGFVIWCPGCKERHYLPDRWKFNGNLESPTFSPSFKHTSTRFHSYTDEGVGIGESFKYVCHYILTDGVLNFCGDSMHELSGKAVRLPDTPKGEEWCTTD